MTKLEFMKVVKSYSFGRLAFRREVIESLSLDEVFEVKTPEGRFRFTRRQFEAEFPKEVKTASYQQRGLYHISPTPKRALKYLVSGGGRIVNGKYGAPDYVLESVDQALYADWLHKKAVARVVRDRKRWKAKIRVADYKMAIHEAVLKGNGLDPHTGEKLAWDLIGRNFSLSGKSLPPLRSLQLRSRALNLKSNFLRSLITYNPRSMSSNLCVAFGRDHAYLYVMKKISHLLFCGLALLLASCASVPLTSTAEDTAAKQFKAPASKANVYVYRGSGLGTALPVQIIADGRITGSLAPNTYQVVTVSPGQHTISTGGSFENVARVTLQTQRDRNYFLKTGPTMGLVLARVKLEQVDEQTGRAAVLKLKRAEASSY